MPVAAKGLLRTCSSGKDQQLPSSKGAPHWTLAVLVRKPEYIRSRTVSDLLGYRDNSADEIHRHFLLERSDRGEDSFDGTRKA